jgi:hypothetical protein
MIDMTDRLKTDMDEWMRTREVQHYGTTLKYGAQRTYKIAKSDVPRLVALGWIVIHTTPGRWDGYDYLAPPPGTQTVSKIIIPEQG